MKHIGLTGGIASGKTTIANMFRYHHIPVFDADSTVHTLYHQPHVVEKIGALFPQAIKDHTVCRRTLSRLLQSSPSSVADLNALIHPIVRQQERRFKSAHRALGTSLIITDIPLMVESKTWSRYDICLMAKAPLWLRKQRAFTRSPHMTEATWQLITSKQATDAQRRRHMHGTIYTGLSKADIMKQVIHWIYTARNQHYGT